MNKAGSAGPRSPLTVGLTGGIACGKTTVAGFLADCGARIIDADAIAHALLEPEGAAWADVVERFGREILDSRGRIDRGALGRRVFGRREELEALNAIVHPLVAEEIDRRLACLGEPGGASIAVVEAALLVETGRWERFDRLVVVTCRRETQLARVVDRPGLSRDDALRRIEAQAPPEQKVALADYVIETDGTLEQTRRRTEEVFAALIEDSETISRGRARRRPRSP